jgi:TolB-like protein/tetratricopeptide (TPR) repeat protein
MAVLPFVNMSGDPDNEYFSDGLTEELLNALVRIGGLKVTGRTSSFAFKGRNVDMREIGQELNVANLLEGSVRKAGSQVRVTAQLVKASDGYHLWSETFDRRLDDIFAIQQEIANKVTESLHVTLLGEDGASARSSPETERNPKAYEEYLRGMYIWQREPDVQGSLDQARERFEASLAIDDQYADAHWGLFRVWDRMHRNAYGPFEQSLTQMQHHADELQRLTPNSDRALSAAARLSMVAYDFGQAAAYLEDAVERYPANVEVLTSYADTLTILGQYGKVMEIMDRAQRLDPLSLDVMRLRSFTLRRVGDCGGAEDVMNRAIEIQPNIARFRYYLAMCLFETTGNAAVALPYAEAEPLNWANETALAILYRAMGDEQSAREKFQSMMDRAGTGASYQFAQIYAQWGEIDKALEWFQTGIEVRDPGISQAGDDRLLEPLKGNPRFDQMLHEIGLR